MLLHGVSLFFGCKGRNCNITEMDPMDLPPDSFGLSLVLFSPIYYSRVTLPCGSALVYPRLTFPLWTQDLKSSGCSYIQREGASFLGGEGLGMVSGHCASLSFLCVFSGPTRPGCTVPPNPHSDCHCLALVFFLLLQQPREVPNQSLFCFPSKIAGLYFLAHSF